MRFGILALLVSMASSLAAQTAPPNQPVHAVEPEPHYDASSALDVMMVVTDIREVPRDNPLQGTHLIAKLEPNKAGTEAIDVYLGPLDFLKDLECTFAKGDTIEVKGSKVKYAGNPVVLAREVRHNSNTVYLRDDHGSPYWKAAGK